MNLQHLEIPKSKEVLKKAWDLVKRTQAKAGIIWATKL